jgi:hypothetical protein
MLEHQEREQKIADQMNMLNIDVDKDGKVVASLGAEESNLDEFSLQNEEVNKFLQEQSAAAKNMNVIASNKGN